MNGQMMESLEAAFDAIVAWYWENADQIVRVTFDSEETGSSASRPRAFASAGSAR